MGLTILGTAWQDLKRDLKATRWLRGLGWFAGAMWFIGLLISAIFLGMMSASTTDSTACQPDGSFSVYPGTFNMWSSTGFFQITLSGGSLNFAQAKAVDIAWDIGVGRGGQVVLALISWREFARYLSICMESEPVSYQVFCNIFIVGDASVISTCRTIKSFVCQRRLRSRVAMIFMVATMVFILAFPTLISAMSGYDSNVSSRVLDRNNYLVPFNEFHRPLYFIQDANRIQEKSNRWVWDNPNYRGDPVLGYASQSDTLLYGIATYVAKYGLGGQRNESSVFAQWYQYGDNITLDAPTLNITAYTLDDPDLPGYNASGALGTTWFKNDELFDWAYMKANGKCQNIDTYKWGFSFLQLYICILLLILWTIGIYTMWIYTHYTLLLRNRLSETVSGEYRAVLELASAMTSELDLTHVDISLMRETQLRKRINREIGGGSVAYAYSDAVLKTHSIRSGLHAWFKRDKWWFCAMVYTTGLCVSFWMVALTLPGDGVIWLWIWFWCVWMGQFWAFCIGTTHGSRGLIVLFWAVLGAVMVGVPAIVYEGSADGYGAFPWRGG